MKEELKNKWEDCLFANGCKNVEVVSRILLKEIEESKLAERKRLLQAVVDIPAHYRNDTEDFNNGLQAMKSDVMGVFGDSKPPAVPSQEQLPH